jgi:methyl acetate hydrolase
MEARLNAIFEATASAKKVPAVGAIVLDSSGKELYKGAFGSTNLSDPSAPPFTTTTNAMLWSCTKLVTCVAALQLFEQGKIGLEDPVEKYVPRITEIQVLDGFEEDGTPRLRSPKTFYS